jgi:hypothetical protein
MINSYDIDGVINLGDGLTGLRPGRFDIIITGRSHQDEREYTLKWLRERGIDNPVIMNPVRFSEKTRQNAGEHKARTINMYWDMHVHVGVHFEDDPIQADIIERECPRVKVVRIVHDLVEKENVWHGPADNTGSPVTQE